ncbi:MAG: 1-acyl-sn-glycerol-3-phosphate acyltransferase [Gemmatimonadota bacterium]
MTARRQLDPTPPPPRWTAAAWRAFELGFRPWRRRRLDGVFLAGLPERLPSNTPVLVVANHTSWWDGFLVREIHRRLRPHSPFYTIMLSQQLRENRVLRWLGARGFTRGSTSSLRALVKWLRERRGATPEALFLFFPQGSLWPPDTRPLGFARGMEGVARALEPVVILPLGICLSMGPNPSPRAFLHMGTPLSGSTSVGEVERAVAAQLDLVREHLTRGGERAEDLWPLDATGTLARVAASHPPESYSAEGEARPS